MFRLWGKVIQKNRMIKNTVICIEDNDTRTHKVLRALEEICKQFDLDNPLWLNKNITEFKRFAKVRFYQDNFISEIDFDYLEIHIIEDD